MQLMVLIYHTDKVVVSLLKMNVPKRNSMYFVLQTIIISDLVTSFSEVFVPSDPAQEFMNGNHFAEYV